MKKERLSALKRETEKLLNEERENSTKDRAFIEEVEQDLEEYERQKEKERIEAQLEAKRKVDALKAENDLLRRMMEGKRATAAAAASAQGQESSTKENQRHDSIHDEFLAVFEAHRRGAGV
jgi:hypothetical protein